MKVMNKQTREIVEAIKNTDGTYTVKGETLTREQMSEQYGKAPEQTTKKESKPMDIQPTVSNESMSNEIDKISKALVKTIGEVSNGKKGKEGYNYKYMTLDSMLNDIRPILLKNGLCITQTHQLNDVLVATHTTLLHESGQYFKSTMEIPLTPSKQLSVPQQVGIVCTYTRRYTIQSLLMIASEEDNDGVIK